MSLSLTRLACAGNAGNSNAPRLWTYKTDDATATVDTAGYFNGAAGLLKVGDIIYRVTVTNLGASNEAVSTYGTHIVNANDGTTVDVSDTTAGTVTDTD